MAISTLFFFHILLFLPFQLAFGNNITLNSTLSTNDKNPVWLSSSSEFAFGFRQINDTNQNLFLLAIWYNKIPDKTIVWNARIVKPVPKGSTVQLTTSGLTLHNPQGEAIWTAEPTESGTVSYGAMLDTGNFVLASSDSSSNSTYVWESFKNPTDTLLPTQNLELQGTLTSRLTESNYTKGRFQLYFDNGDLFLSGIGWPDEQADSRYKDEGIHRLLVYEFMSNGSLADILFGQAHPNWNLRVTIAMGIARGLVYLHEECATPIIHCDIKPQNVLIDDHFTPKISDFGLAKLLMFDQSKTQTMIRGTRGYVAPEWFKPVPVTAKVDVYSFGVMLLEIICCRRSVLELEEEEKVILTDWAYDCLREGIIDALVGEDKEAMADKSRLKKWVMIAIWCIQEHHEMRPTMKTAMHMLEGLVEVPYPPSPISFTLAS